MAPFLGPCENPEDLFEIDPETRQASCIPRGIAKSKRIFDVLPSNMRQNGESFDGSGSGFGANTLNCLTGGSKCSTGTGRLGKVYSNILGLIKRPSEISRKKLGYFFGFFSR